VRKSLGRLLRTVQRSSILGTYRVYGRPGRSDVIQQKLRKVGNSYVVTIPKDEVLRRGLKEGQLLAVEVQPLDVQPRLRPELREAFEASWAEHEAAYRYLGEH
jgi:antitoxin component of MazEF toxin-antitoxin module